MNCAYQTDQYLPDIGGHSSPHPEHCTAIVIEKSENNSPMVIRTTNIDEEVLELNSRGYKVLERVERATTLKQLISHARQIEASVLIYQSNDEFSSHPEKPQVMQIPMDPEHMDIDSQGENHSMHIDFDNSQSANSDDYARFAVFMVGYE